MMNDHGSYEFMMLAGETDVLGEKPIPVKNGSTQIPHRLACV
jgi:hypothetical protein